MDNIKSIIVFVELENGDIRQVCTSNYIKQTALHLMVDAKTGKLNLGPKVQAFKIQHNENSNN